MEAAIHGDEKMSELVRVLRGRFIEVPPLDYQAGKTALRNALMSHYRCTATRAESIVDRMEKLGHLVFEQGVWRIE